jgi:hypothetical protein
VKYLEEEEEGNEVLDLTLDDVLDDLVKVREYFGEEWNCYYHPIYHRYFYRGKKSGRYFYFTDTGEVVYLK